MLPLLFDLVRRNWALIAAILVAFSVGWGGAWHIRSLAVVEIEQEFHSYRLHIKEQEIQAAERADSARQQASADYRRVKDDLQKQIEAHDVYRRCVAAGRCGVRVVAGSCRPPASIPPAGGPDAARPDPVPPGAGASAEITLANECAVTTLMLNKLQAAIEGQEGY